MSYQTLSLELDAQGIATLMLNRPNSRNALNVQMCAEFLQVLDAIEKDPQVRVVLVRGAGTVFCAGADLKERKTMSNAEMMARRIAGLTAYNAIEKVSRPVVALVHGPAYGSGCEIVAACDFAWATDQATFRYPEVGWGTVGATQRIPRIAGLRMAKELLFTGRIFTAAEALEYGLVNRVLDAGRFESEAMEMARHIALAQPLTVSLTKHSLNAGVETTREGAMAIELLAIEKNLRGMDWKAAIAGFGSTQET
jgi:enoyl-CoA hydratase